jgi:hypothetical protein
VRVLPVAAWLAGAMAGPLYMPSNQLGLGLATAGDGIFELGWVRAKMFRNVSRKNFIYLLPFTIYYFFKE